jgi:hypothetical protein
MFRSPMTELRTLLKSYTRYLKGFLFDILFFSFEFFLLSFLCVSNLIFHCTQRLLSMLCRVRTGCWVGECFIYTTSSNRLNYCVGARTETISHLDRRMYLLGYLPKYSRVFLIDKVHIHYSFIHSF